MLEKELHFPKDCTAKREANMSLDDMEMKTDDLLEKEQIDSGGFGMVSLCFHRNHGLVILKNVYTGPKRTEYNAALLEEGKIMHKLKHNRVVKFLGFILEDGNYSLVMEYMEKGNLMKVLKTTSIPLSVKGRIILEIIEGMCYLHKEGVIHKDLKPENILVDDDFHVKVLARDSTTSGVLVLPSGCLLLNELLGTWSCLQSSQPRSQPHSPPESLKSSGRTKVKMT